MNTDVSPIVWLKHASSDSGLDDEAFVLVVALAALKMSQGTLSVEATDDGLVVICNAVLHMLSDHGVSVSGLREQCCSGDTSWVEGFAHSIPPDVINFVRGTSTRSEMISSMLTFEAANDRSPAT